MRPCSFSAESKRLRSAPTRSGPLARGSECAAEPRHAARPAQRLTPAAIGPQRRLPSSRRARGRETWHACTSVGGPHHANVAAVVPPAAEYATEDDVADGEVVSEVADRDSLERIYALSGVGEVADLAGLDSLLEQVEQLGQEADTAVSDAMRIPDILGEAQKVSAALNAQPRRQSKPRSAPAERGLTPNQELKLAREASVKPSTPRRTRTAAGAAALTVPPASASAGSPDAPSTSGRHVSSLRQSRTSGWGRAVKKQQSSERQARSQRASASTTVAEFMRDVDAKLLTFEEEQAIAGRAARYCKVAAQQEELSQRLRRVPTTRELAAHLGTDDVRSIEELLLTGKGCKDLMVHANTRLVMSIAKAANRTREVNLTDLVDEGMTGLHNAVERFEASRGLKFSTYATWWVRQAVLRAHARLSGTVYVPSSTKQAATRVSQFRVVFLRDHGRFPSRAEIAEGCGVSEERVKQLLATRLSSVSLQTPATGVGGEGGELHETIADEAELHVEAAEHHADAMRTLEAAIDQLPEREARALRLRHGLEPVSDGSPEGTPAAPASNGLVPLVHVARVLCVSKERARQLEKRALSMLRRRSGQTLQDAMSSKRAALAGGDSGRASAAVNRRS